MDNLFWASALDLTAEDLDKTAALLRNSAQFLRETQQAEANTIPLRIPLARLAALVRALDHYLASDLLDLHPGDDNHIAELNKTFKEEYAPFLETSGYRRDVDSSRGSGKRKGST